MVEINAEVINILIKIQNNYNKEISNRIFGELSNHLYSKWLNCNKNILAFISQLDYSNKTKFFKWVNKNIFKY